MHRQDRRRHRLKETQTPHDAIAAAMLTRLHELEPRRG
jgi:hypothetical protein